MRNSSLQYNTNNYYLFGLQHGSYNTPARDYRPIGDAREIETVDCNPYKYKYNSKEWQNEIGLDWYDYGARNYDASLGRWMNVDPLAEKFPPISPYNYVANSPVNFIDPDGKDIYRMDKDSGEIILMEENDDDHDQIVNAKYNRKTKEYEIRRNKDGELRKGSIRVNNIEKNILQDGMNLFENSYAYEVGGENQPTADGIEQFALGLSNYVDKEIQGSNFSKIGEENISYVFIGRYKGNTATKAKGGWNFNATNRRDLAGKITNNEWKEHWHTHLSRFRNKARLNPSDPDLIYKNKFKIALPDLRFKIITTPKNQNF